MKLLSGAVFCCGVVLLMWLCLNVYVFVIILQMDRFLSNKDGTEWFAGNKITPLKKILHN